MQTWILRQNVEPMGRTSNTSYLGFPCANCKQPVIALTIPRGMAMPKMGQGKLHLQCSHCDWQDDYSTLEVRRFEIEQMAG